MARSDTLGSADTEVSNGEATDGLKARAKSKIFGGEGQTIGRYAIVSELGAGGMGVVFAGYDAELDRKVAVKLLKREMESDADRLRLKREAQAMAKLSHPNVAHVYEVGEQDGRVFVAMEFVPGSTLREWGRASSRGWGETLAMHRQAALGLAAAHEAGIVHRDYKPDNVLVGDDGRPRVLDFGLARPEGVTVEIPAESVSALDSPLTRTGSLLGTPAYMAPEQLRGERADARSDQFAYCVALYEALYGQRPFPGANLVELAANVQAGVVAELERGQVPPSVHAAILKGLSADPQARHASIEALLAALEVAPSKKRSRVWLYLLAVAGIVAIPSAFGVPFMAELEQPVTPEVNEDPNAAIFRASDLPPRQEEPLAEDPLGVTVHRLDNGLTVYISPQHDRPRVLAAVVVRAGLLDDPPDAPGIAGVVEHMMRAGTRKIGTLEWDKERPHVEKQHALLEAHATTTDPDERARLVAQMDQAWVATHDVVVPEEQSRVMFALGMRAWQSTRGLYTVFGADVPGPRFEAWAALEGDRFQNATFRGFAGEMATLVDTWRTEYDGSFQHWYAGLELATYAEVRHERASEAELFASLPYAQARAFHEAWYRPNNAAIVLVGDVDARTALPVLEQNFGAWEPAALPAERPSNARVDGDEALTMSVPNAGFGVVAWRNHSPKPGTATLRHLLKAAFGRPGVDATLTNAESYGGADHLFAVRVGSAAGGESAAVLLARSELEAIANGTVPRHPIETAALQREVAFLKTRTLPHLAADRIAAVYSAGHEWKAAVERERHVPAPEEVAAAARALLDGGTVSVVPEPGSYTPPALVVTAASEVPPDPARRSTFAASLIDGPVARLQPQFLTEGRDYVVTRRGPALLITAKSELPLFTLTVRYPREPEFDATQCRAAEAMLARGPLAEVRSTMDPLGVTVDTECGERFVSLMMNGPEKSFAAAWEFFWPWATTFNLTKSGVQEFAKEMNDLRELNRGFAPGTEGFTRAWALGLVDRAEMSFGEITSETLTPAARRMRRLEPDVLFVGRNTNAVRERLGEPRPAKRRELPPVQHRRVEEPTIFYNTNTGMAQARMSVSLVRSAFPKADEVLGHVYAEYLVGASGLARAAFETQTDEVHGFFVVPDKPGGEAVMVVGVSVNAEETVDVLQSLLGVLVRPLDEDAFERAKAAHEEVMRTTRVHGDFVPTYVHSGLARGHSGDPRQAQWDELARLDFERFSKFVEAMRESPPIVAVASNPTRFDEEKLGSMAKLVRAEN